MGLVWVLVLVLALITVLSLGYAAHCYHQLWLWAKQCQSAQIAIAYKRRVVLVAPLVEFLLWSRQLTGREENGRVIYLMGQTRVAIIKGDANARQTIRRALRTGKEKQGGSRAPQVTEGTWAARDETRQEA